MEFKLADWPVLFPPPPGVPPPPLLLPPQPVNAMASKNAPIPSDFNPFAIPLPQKYDQLTPEMNKSEKLLAGYSEFI